MIIPFRSLLAMSALTSAVLFAQSPASPAAVPGPELSSACRLPFSIERPVGLTATQRPASDRGEEVGQAFTLVFSTAQTAPLREVRLTLRGSASRAGLLLTPAASRQTSETFTIRPVRTGEDRMSATLTTHDLFVVSRATLTQVVFADGTSWDKAASSACTATPSPVVLTSTQAEVGSHR